ncbi:helix-turn-helix domain-containing protein [Lysinibacillus irui]|uniref:helix-turn-helix domain-containing protein n=1 Tax=Lysinibacillus irui TaxID=2998077 RepID=UPI002AD34C23|nr:helix-turn-helix domain-containing protein [Lysinibacillus irui]MEA0565685.1 helix-turn-helix domain-containing protein [Lysinibacillus irui]
MAFEYLAQYITFDSVADMDKSVEDHMAVHYYDLTESERAIVFKLASHSLEHTGVCHLKASTIATSLEISTKTVYRSMKKLAELGIIEKVPSTKLNGIKGASIYRILPYVPSSVSQRETADEASNDAVCPPQSENQASKSFNLLSSKQANNIMSLGNELAL